MLCDAAEKMNVNFNSIQSTELIEEKLLEKVLTDTWEKMDEAQRSELLNAIGRPNLGGIGASTLITIFRAGGFKSYQISLWIVNAIAKLILGRGISLAGNVIIARTLSILAGPIGWAISAVWTTFDVASTAYRVTIPACIYIAALRKMKANEKFAFSFKQNHY